MEDQLREQVAVVTGASSGIGAATARALARAGAAVVLAARRQDRLDALAQEINGAGGRALAIATDVVDRAATERLIDRACEELGRIDILINNAGVMLIGSIRNADIEHWRRMIDVNVLGLLYCTHAVVPLMEAQGGGQIVNISSLAGRRGQPNMAVYCLTKWGVLGFSEALRQELLAANIRVIVIEPGMVDTELQGHNVDAWAREELVAAKERIGEPLAADDVARATVYALSQPAYVALSEMLIRPARSV